MMIPYNNFLCFTYFTISILYYRISMLNVFETQKFGLVLQFQMCYLFPIFKYPEATL